MIEEGKRKLVRVVIQKLRKEARAERKFVEDFFPSSDAKLELICVEVAKLQHRKVKAFGNCERNFMRKRCARHARVVEGDRRDVHLLVRRHGLGWSLYE